MFLHWWQFVFYSFCLITAIRIFYYLFFFSRLAFYKQQQTQNTQTHPVTVIICARDEVANLTKNLPGVLAQQYSSTHEIIVVNDNSFDETKYLLEAFYKKFKQLHIINLTQEAKLIPGKKFPLSVGIKTAKYEVLLLTDADCVPATEFWIDKMQQGYKDNTEIVLGYGPYFKRKGMLNKLIRWETFHTALQYLSYAKAGLPYMGVGRNLSYKKSVFFRHKGFSSHNNIASGDDDLFINMAANKKNTEIMIDKDSFTLSEPPITRRQWMRQKNRHYSTGRYYKPLHKFLLALYSISHFVFYPLFVISLIYSGWKISLLVFGIHLILQAFIYIKTMKKLDENDLIPYFVLLDVWMFFYYMIFSFSLFKKPASTWK
ncbi:glycosyltransferase [soil metagenome]